MQFTKANDVLVCFTTHFLKTEFGKLFERITVLNTTSRSCALGWLPEMNPEFKLKRCKDPNVYMASIVPVDISQTIQERMTFSRKEFRSDSSEQSRFSSSNICF